MRLQVHITNLKTVCIAVFSFVIICIIGEHLNESSLKNDFLIGHITSKFRNLRSLIESQEAMRNAYEVKAWRDSIKQACEVVESEDDMLKVRQLAQSPFPQQKHEHESKENEDLQPANAVQRCPFVFLDLGSGVGDSIGNFIDAGLPGCQSPDYSFLSFDAMHFDVDTGIINDAPGNRRGEADGEFEMWLKERMTHFYYSMGPEDYCVYGVEGNPILKPDLLKLERHILRMEPRPFRHLHFFTETVVHDSDDQQRTIFLDTVHAKDRFPGSSLFNQHVHVQHSVKRDGERTEFFAKSITLTSLMKQTLSIYGEDFDDINSDITKPVGVDKFERVTGQHLLLHIDVEGAEFHILNEAKDSGVLCEFAKNGNVVDIFVEYHHPDTLGVETENALRYIKEVRPYFRRECGDNISFYERQRYFMPPSPSQVISNAIF